METPGPTTKITLDETLRLFGEVGQQCVPLTAREVADELGCTRRTAYRKLEELADRGDLSTKKTGARSRVWWRPVDRERTTSWSGLRSAELEQFGAFVQAVRDYAIFMLDPNGNIASWNAGAERIKGYERDEILGEHFSIFYSDADVEGGVPEQNLEAASAEGRYEDEGWRVRMDGTRFWANVVITAIHDDEGTLLGFTKVTRDLTERREYEAALEARKRELESELGEVFGRISDAFYALDDEWRFTHVNERAESIIGRSSESVLGEPIWDEFPDASSGTIRERYEWAMENQEPVSFEHFYGPLDGWIKFNVYPSETGLSVYFQDVTDRVEREHELERYERIVETVDDGVYTVDTDGRFTFINEAYAEMTGYAHEELLGSSVTTVVGEETIESAQQLEQELVAGERETAKIEADLTTADGGTIRAEATFALIPGEDGAYERVGVVRDVTARVERERLLEESERRYRTLVDHFPNGGVALYDEGLRYSIVGGEMFDENELPPEDLVGTSIYERYPEDIVSIVEPYFRAGLRGETNTFEVEYNDRDMLAYTLPIEDADGEVLAGMLMVQDVTELKDRERELARFKRAVEASGAAIYMTDTDGHITYVNNAYEHATGYSADEAIGETPRFVKPGEDQDEFYRRTPETVRPGDVWEEEIVDRRKSGERYYAEQTIAPVFDEDGDIDRFVAVQTDITDRREREEALARYKTVFDTVDDGIYILDPEFHFDEVNDAYVEMTGYEKDELIGSHCSLVVGDEVSAEAADLAQKLASGESESAVMEADVITADGGRIPGESRFTALPSVDGEFRGSVGVVRDLTDRKAYEHELEARAGQQNVIAELGQFALENPDLDELFAEAVEAISETLENDYCKVLELQPSGDELFLRAGVGWRTGLVGHAMVGTGLDSQAGYTLRSERPIVVEDLGTEDRFHGPALLTDHDVISGISTIIGPNAAPWGVLGTHDTERCEFTDYDVNFVQSVANILSTAIARKMFEEELNETVEKLKESNERLEQFAYISSHDLQEPLRMISNYLQLLDDRYRDDLDEDAHEFIDYAVDGANRMRAMIQDLLRYSRVGSHAEPFEPTDCSDLVGNVRNQLQIQIEENDAEVVVEDLPTVFADENQLEQVFQNLVSNALKYRRDEPPRIDIGVEKRTDEWRFHVADNGIGIDRKHRDRIFEVFKRLHTHEEYPGTGIGLSLCEKIVDRHGGRIWVESEPGEGSTFFFTIPREPRE